MTFRLLALIGRVRLIFQLWFIFRLSNQLICYFRFFRLFRLNCDYRLVFSLNLDFS